MKNVSRTIGLQAALALAVYFGSSIDGAAAAAAFKVGDRVIIGSTQATGVVIAVGQPLTDGGTMIKVHLDSLAPGFPTVGAWYDSATSNVTVTGSGAPPAQSPSGGPIVAHPVARHPQAAPGGSNTAPPGAVPVSADACKQAIRANYPPGGSDQTMTIDFQSFEMSGLRPYEAVYANDLAPPAGRGHTVQAAPVHAKFTVLTHYADPNADDELRTYDANYMCYRSATSGALVVEMTSRKPGGETAQYISKH